MAVQRRPDHDDASEHDDAQYAREYTFLAERRALCRLAPPQLPCPPRPEMMAAYGLPLSLRVSGDMAGSFWHASPLLS